MSKHNDTQSSSLHDYLLALEKHRQSYSIPEKRKSYGDGFIIGGLIALQIISALIILAILYPINLSGSSASFDAPSTADINWVIPTQPTTPADPFTSPTITEAPTVVSTPTPQPILPPHPPLSSIRIRGLEITQGIQVFNEPENTACNPNSSHRFHILCNNSVPLIAGRHTLLRLYLACEDDCPGTDGQVQVHILKDGQEQGVLTQPLSAGWLSQINGLPLNDLRLNLDRSINFKLFPPPAWLVGQITFEIEVISSAPDEAPATLSVGRNFAIRKPLRIAYLPIQYQGATPAEMSDADYWLQRLYPVSTVEYYRLSVPDLVWDKEIDKGEILNELLYTYWLYTQHNPSETWPDQLFGWLPQEFYNGGAADPNWCPNCAGPHSARIAFGGVRPEQDIGGPRILAHEIAHNLGAQHAWTPTEQQDNTCFRAEGTDIQVDPYWPYAETPYIQEVGVDVYSDPPVIYGPNNYDMMSYCASPWISPHTYRRLFESPLLQSQAVASIPAADFEPTSSSLLLISGMIYPDGRASHPDVVQLEHSVGQPPSLTVSGKDYCLDILGYDEHLMAQRCFEAGFLNVETGLPTEASPYFLTFAQIDPDDIAKITLRRATVELISLRPSKTSPQIEIVYPNNGEVLSGPSTITWQGSDADGDDLTYDVLYSPDSGQSWLPLATRLHATSYTFTTAHLPPTQQALIRIIASDGFHTSSDDADKPFILAD